MKRGNKKSKYPLIVFSLILLCSPNISIIDILPDFIAYFILANAFLEASDRAPFFKEARDSFIKLGWVTLLKAPALLVIMWSKSNNGFGNDMFAICSFVFAIFELILLFSAIRNTFDALFRLGERTDADALINPIYISKRKSISTDAIRGFTYVFAIVKAACSCLPDMLLLTTMRETNHGMQIITIDPKYPIALLVALITSLVFGILWYRRIKRYVKAIAKSEQFNSALDKISINVPKERLIGLERVRLIKRVFLLLSVTFVLSIEMRFDNLYGVNLLPPTLFGILLIISLISSKKLFDKAKTTIILAAIYTVLSTVTYVLEARFLTNYGYDALLTDDIAYSQYVPVMMLTTISCILFLLMIISLVFLLNRFSKLHTGISPDSENYGVLEKEYHRSLIIKNYVFGALAILSSVVKTVYVITSGSTEWVFTNINDVSQPVITAPSIEWIGFAARCISLIFILYTLYHLSTLKDEAIAKYEFD